MMRINLSFPDMNLANITNPSKTDTIAGIKPLESKWLWFSFKYIKQYGIEIPDALNQGNLLAFDFNGNPIQFYDIASESSRLIRDVKKYPNGYLWNIDIGTLIFCKIRFYIDSLDLSIPEKLQIYNEYNQLFNLLRNGCFKECIHILNTMLHNKHFNRNKIKEICILLETSDAI